jgi:hypothetical protein
MNTILILVQVFDEGEDPSFIKKLMPFIRPFIFDADEEALIQKRQFSQALGEDIKAEIDGFEDVAIGFETNLGPCMFRLSNLLQLCLGIPPLIDLMIDLAISPYFQLNIFGKGIDHREAYPVKPSGDLIAQIIEFPSRMEFCHNDFYGRAILFFMDINWNTPAIIPDRHTIVDKNDYFDSFAISSQGFIDTVIDQLVNQMMKAFDSGVSDIHGRPFPYGSQPIQYLDLLCIILFRHPLSYFSFKS